VILDALVEQLADTGAFDFSMFELARRANVSARTIYRHFPSREALFDALAARIKDEIGFQEYPRTLAGTSELARRLFPSFDAHAPLVVAFLATRQAHESRPPARPERRAAVQRAVAHAAPGASAASIRYCAAVIACLVTPEAWACMRRELRMDGREGGAAIAWAIDALVRQLETEQKKAKGR
jgi:AcrR family transcriptional regulator